VVEAIKQKLRPKLLNVFLNWVAKTNRKSKEVMRAVISYYEVWQILVIEK
jgi:hypothetical protein